MRNHYLISIGSNHHPTKMLHSARCYLQTLFSPLTLGKEEETTPFDMPLGTANFHNQLIAFFSPLSPDEVEKELKSIEKKLGRTPGEKKKGVVTIDIDILKINGEEIRPCDLQRPYLQQMLRCFPQSDD